jgi:hypothetical protein
VPYVLTAGETRLSGAFQLSLAYTSAYATTFIEL